MSSVELAEDMGLVPETVNEHSDGESLASGSAHSRSRGQGEPVHFRDLVQLGQSGCRVIMTVQGIKRVCGNTRAGCKRRNHTAMGEDRRAGPGYYEAYFTRTGETDGLLENHWSDEQVRQTTPATA